jgi:hypothetical protein
MPLKVYLTAVTDRVGAINIERSSCLYSDRSDARRNIAGVVVNGALIGKAALQKMLAAAERAVT